MTDQSKRVAVLIAVVVAAAAAAAPAGACACGIALQATVTRERALVIDRGDGREVIVASFDLAADGGGRPAVVMPVPGDPEVRAIERGDPLAYLDLATAPPPETGGSDEGVAGAAPQRAPGVDVIGRETIGGYDVSRLRAGDPDALGDWLTEHGYEQPDGAEEILADYVEEGWRYVAIRLAPGGDGRLKPLRISFRSEQPVYPMRLTQLGTDPVDLTLYVLADGPRAVQGLESGFDGPVDELEPAPPEELRTLLGAAPHLTKLTATDEDPSSFTEDLEIVLPTEAIDLGELLEPGGGDDDGVDAAWILLGIGLLAGAARLALRSRP